MSAKKSISGERKRVKRRPRGEGRNKAEGARQRILKAAKHIFSLHSYRAASTRMIAQEAGVDHPLIHYHYGSKEKLFEQVAAVMSEEFGLAHRSWLKGLEEMSVGEGLSLYLDRLLDYCLDNPQPLQLIFLNMMHIGRLEEIPGYRYVVLHMDGIRSTLEEKIPVRGSRAEIEMFIHCFHTLLIPLLGAKLYHAEILRLDSENGEYRKWVKDSCMVLFQPFLQRLIFPDGVPENGPRGESEEA